MRDADALLSHRPTCYNPDTTKVTFVTDMTETHPVRCYSPSIDWGASVSPLCANVTLQEAIAVCAAYR
eukprot:1350822-Pyramimonas_sp.AAC.1